MKLTIGVIGQTNIDISPQGSQFISKLLASDSIIVPTKIGNFEPLKPIEFNSLAKYWRDPLLWSNGKISNGSLFFDERIPRFNLSIIINIKKEKINEIRKIMECVFSLVPDGFRFLHPIDKIEWEFDADFAQEAYLGFISPDVDLNEIKNKVLYYQYNNTSIVNKSVLERYNFFPFFENAE
jgi:hypothetical protein